MSVYHKVNSSELALCLESLSNQTQLPDQFLIIKDGPLGTDLDQLLEKFSRKHPKLVSLLSLPENLGLIAALNAGLQKCEGDWIIRMDADDVASPERIETQLSYLKKHPDIDVLGSAMLEFEEDPNRPLRKKKALQGHQEIRAQLPYRNPMNHPTVCIRKSLLIQAGGYPVMPLLEDYFLWAKLVLAGATFHNQEQALHLFRFDNKTLERRAGFSNFLNECRLRIWMYQQGLMPLPTLILILGLQAVLRLSPRFLRQLFWKRSRSTLS